MLYKEYNLTGFKHQKITTQLLSVGPKVAREINDTLAALCFSLLGWDGLSGLFVWGLGWAARGGG